MDVEVARWLVSDDAVPALTAAGAEPDPSSLAAAGRLRRDFPPEQAAAALTQVGLRRRAVTKFGETARRLFFTPDGLEQATRGEVAAWRAARYRAAAVADVVDLGCGLGADALAFAAAGLNVRAVEADPATAVLASANLGQEVICGDAVELAAPLLASGAAVFADPARRTSSGRTWRVSDFSPPFDFATGLLDGRFGCIKAAPGLPSAMIPDQVGVTWVSHRGDLVETSLWSTGERAAVLLPSGEELAVGGDRAPIGEPGRYLYEPDPAVIRSGAINALAAHLGAWRPADGIGYLFSDELRETPFARAFSVAEVLAYDERALRAFVREHGVGVLEIKCRGVDVDPAALRRRLKPSGPASATLVITPTPSGVRTLVVARLGE
ncbi:MAG: class I SAM-dependent methyltransferase [Actinobacteria bacterium HGW-Actinobacteria-2]|nr:MAG: class I SAM-dependent methyltransferase [Actinobacteria bacterium HGW-Actinobacteria-2]